MNNKNIFKKILCCLGVVFAFIFSFFTFKNTNQLLISKADTTITSFLGSNFNVETKVYQNDSVVNSDYAFLNLKFNFNNINGNSLKIDFSGISQLYSGTDAINNYVKTTSNIDKFLNVQQGETLYHYKFNDDLGLVRGDSFSFDVTFYSNNTKFSKMRFSQFLVSQEGYYDDTSVYVDASWTKSIYRDIYVVGSVSNDLSSFLASRSTFIGSSSSSSLTPTDTLVLPLAKDKTNIVISNILLDESTMKYTFLRVTAKNLDNLDFLGVTLKYDTSDISQTYYSLQYFTSSGGILILDFIVPNDSTLPEKTYYFTSTSADNYNLGYQDGYSKGNLDGKQLGYNQGFDNGRSDGYNSGYNSGYSAGVESAHNYTFLSLISAVVTAPFTAFKSIFNFDLLGVNVLTLLGSLFTIAVVITIIKKVI